jgi:hypothetical protein
MAGIAYTAGTCDGARTCDPGTIQGCLPYACNGDVCLTSCTSDAECTGSPEEHTYCDAGKCEAALQHGQSCTANDQGNGGLCEMTDAGSGTCN